MIGLTSDAFAGGKSHPVRPYGVRRSAVEEFAEKFDRGVGYEIEPLSDRYGSALDLDFDALVVSEETLPVAIEINRLRRERGRRKVDIHQISLRPRRGRALDLVDADPARRDRRARKGHGGVKLGAGGRTISLALSASDGEITCRRLRRRPADTVSRGTGGEAEASSRWGGSRAERGGGRRESLPHF